MRLWQMEPLPPAAIAGLTPSGVEIVFYDDRMEPVDFDAPVDLAAISVETYTAKRAYQIASEFRRRGVPVVMGGFHAALCPQEVARYADAVVIGEAEGLWEQVLADAERGALATYYQSAARPPLAGLRPDRSIYAGKNYLPVGLVEFSRGCHYRCDFCAIQTVFHRSQNCRPPEDILAELETQRRKPLVFFVDDNLTASPDRARQLLEALIPLKMRWVSQVSLEAALDEDLLALMARSGCQGVLIGFESLNPANLEKMNKRVNLSRGEPAYEQALANLRRHNIRLYITFVFGYNADTPDSFGDSLDFAMRQRFYIAAFNHLTPFPGTPLYHRLQAEGRLRFDAWWLDEGYSYNQLPFYPVSMTPEAVQRGCVETRAQFYSWPNIWRRGLDPVNRSSLPMWLHYYGINAMFRREVRSRDDFPLGDQDWQGELLPVRLDPPGPTLLNSAASALLQRQDS
jgi:radical SAM superfamily enzyme YgiQ (UPF0313 family)